MISETPAPPAAGAQNWTYNDRLTIGCKALKAARADEQSSTRSDAICSACHPETAGLKRNRTLGARVFDACSKSMAWCHNSALANPRLLPILNSTTPYTSPHLSPPPPLHVSPPASQCALPKQQQGPPSHTLPD